MSLLTEAELAEAAVLIASPKFSHSRAGSGCWRNIVWLYHHDRKSPSGVTLVFGGEASQLEPILAKRPGASPLSPVEPR